MTLYSDSYTNTNTNTYSNSDSDVESNINKTKKQKKKKIQIDFNVNDNLLNNKNNINNSPNIYVFNCNCNKKITTLECQKIYCNCPNEIKNNYYVGINCTSLKFSDCSILMLNDCITNSMGIHIKSSGLTGIYSVRLYINNNPTQFLTTILNGATTLYAINNYEIKINQFDLIAFRIELNNDNVLTNGINISLSYNDTLNVNE